MPKEAQAQLTIFLETNSKTKAIHRTTTLPKAIQYASGTGSKPSVGLFQQLSNALLDIFTEEVEEAPIGISQLSRQTFRAADINHPTSSQSQATFQSQPFRNQPFQDYRFPGLVQDSQA